MVAVKPKSGKAAWARNILTAAAFLVLAVGLLGALLYGNYSINRRQGQLQARLEQLQTEQRELEERTAELTAKIEQQGTVESAEKVLREQGLYKKEGEQVVTVLRGDRAGGQEQEGKERVWWNPLTWF